MLKSYLVLPVLLIFSALALAACGSGKSDEEQITEAIQTSATGNDPANCTKLETQAFVEQNSDEEGKAAVKECEKEAEEDNAESVAVSEVEVDGSKATADAAVTGGSLDGQAVTISLVKDGDQWKLDQITGFAKLDQQKLVEAFETKLAEPSSELSQAQSGCVAEGLEEASQPELEEFLFSGSSESFVELIESCS